MFSTRKCSIQASLARVLLPCALLLSGCANFEQLSASTTANNAELAAIKEADQADRSLGASTDWAQVSLRDKERLTRVRAIVSAGQLRSAVDYFNAALVFQHGPEIADIRMAYSLATVSAAIDPNLKNALWLAAAAWDRLLMRQGKPQWYGTQFTRAKSPGAKWELYQIDETAVTDEDRKKLNVPTLDEARERARNMNQMK